MELSSVLLMRPLERKPSTTWLRVSASSLYPLSNVSSSSISWNLDAFISMSWTRRCSSNFDTLISSLVRLRLAPAFIRLCEMPLLTKVKKKVIRYARIVHGQLIAYMNLPATAVLSLNALAISGSMCIYWSCCRLSSCLSFTLRSTQSLKGSPTIVYIKLPRYGRGSFSRSRCTIGRHTITSGLTSAYSSIVSIFNPSK